MGTKQEPGAFDAHEKALPDEPTFTLLARDWGAPHMVRQWAYQRLREISSGERPESEIAQVDSAISVANEMVRWRRDNDGKWRK